MLKYCKVVSQVKFKSENREMWQIRLLSKNTLTKWYNGLSKHVSKTIKESASNIKKKIINLFNAKDNN